ncbi:YhfC family glutamic-type intramembrane protease [Faecalispora anaeroviscerum]|uniref:YhfC family glutamic-type intramembrane protease n=1 Tax=Faecalispora anaeroviscerum TaxID=2991836 RepID=UPI0024B993F5|nr:YhfC family glutamic-type intramembrane protease [Faecalispora anaeroviscerum]
MPDSPTMQSGRTFRKYLWWFLLGAACFSLSQPLLRIPLLGLVNHSVWFTMFSMLHPVPAVVAIGLSAGVFEEGFRFLCKRFLLRPAKCTMVQPLLFGLGHGGTEACLILIPLLLQGYAFWELQMALMERALAMLLHLSLTVVVWNGFQTGRRFRYLAAAIVLHGLVDSVLPLLAQRGMQVAFVELIFAGMVLCVGAYAIASRRLYLQGGTENEEKNEVL